MDSRDSLNETPDSIDLTESPVEYKNTQKNTEKSNEDTNDNDTDEINEFNKDKVTKMYRKDTNGRRKMIMIRKSKKGRTTRVHAINIERKRLLKQRREKAIQNAKDRKIGKANAQIALKTSTRANKASKDTYDITMIDEKDIDDFSMTEDPTTGEDSTVHVHLPPHSHGKSKGSSQIKTSSKHTIKAAEPSIGDPLQDSQATVKINGHMPDPSDIGIYEFLIEGAPNPPDLEGIEDYQ